MSLKKGALFVQGRHVLDTRCTHIDNCAIVNRPARRARIARMALSGGKANEDKMKEVPKDY